MKRKGDFLVWGELYKWIIAIIFAVIVLLIIFSNKTLFSDMLEKIKDFLRFGT